MKFFVWAFFVFLTFLIQTQFSIFNTPLNLTVVLSYSFALKSLPRKTNTFAFHSMTDGYFGSRAEMKSTAFGALVGLLEDIISGSIIGPNFFSKGLIGFISVVAFTEVVFKWTPVFGVIMVTVFTVLDGVIVASSRIVFSNIQISMLNAVQTLIIQAIVNIPFGIIFKPAKFRLTD